MHSEAVLPTDPTREQPKEVSRSAEPSRTSALRDSEDSELIAWFLNGQESAFETLFRRYQHRFLALARRFLTDQTEAEDVVQEAFVDIYHGLRRFRQSASFCTWAYRIVTRKCAERQRQQTQRNIAPASLDTFRALPHGDEMPSADSVVVQQAMRRLPDEARLLLILKYYEQFSGEEIAQIIHCNVGQAKMRVHRAKNALKQQFAAMGIVEMGTTEMLNDIRAEETNETTDAVKSSQPGGTPGSKP